MNRKEESPMDRTYRFWTRHNGHPVRLSLKVGDEINLVSGGPTDEGWSRNEEHFYIDRERGLLVLDYAFDGCDCDGRMSGGSESYAQLDELAATPERWIYCHQPTALQRLDRGDRPVRVPNWRPLDSWQRDFQAEAAGF